jgi:hypothetical protein
MTRSHRHAFNALKKMGVPVIEMDGSFIISGEESNSYLWVDYWNGYRRPGWNCGTNPELDAVLKRYGLFCEWQNPGCMSVHFL